MGVLVSSVKAFSSVKPFTWHLVNACDHSGLNLHLGMQLKALSEPSLPMLRKDCAVQCVNHVCGIQTPANAKHSTLMLRLCTWGFFIYFLLFFFHASQRQRIRKIAAIIKVSLEINARGRRCILIMILSFQPHNVQTMTTHKLALISGDPWRPKGEPLPSSSIGKPAEKH